jgi:predicted tellurium resistance membrane protein TerC
LLADLADRFHLLKYGLAFVLTFIGIKMLLPLFAEGLIMVMGEGSQSGLADFARRFIGGEFKQEVINISLGAVVVMLALSVILSIIFPSKKQEKEHIEEKIETE